MAEKTILTPKMVMRPFKKEKLPAVYARIFQLGPRIGFALPGELKVISYDDDASGSRIIKGERVEAAVEQADFINIAKQFQVDIILHADGTVSLYSEETGKYLVHKKRSLRDAVMKFCIDNKIEL